MKTVKTARGRTIDMGALAAKYETARAVSNAPINARGDIIDNRGNITTPKSEIQKEYYKDNVPGADEQAVAIKGEEEAPKKSSKKKSEPVAPIEVDRRVRTRADGTEYFEVEYDDGSMEEIDV